MAYRPCEFDRKDYLKRSKIFESVSLDDVEEELCEHGDDATDLAYELAYTRYHLAKSEEEVERMKKLCHSMAQLPQKRMEYYASLAPAAKPNPVIVAILEEMDVKLQSMMLTEGE